MILANLKSTFLCTHSPKSRTLVLALSRFHHHNCWRKLFAVSSALFKNFPYRRRLNLEGMSTTEILCCHSGVWAILIGGTEIVSFSLTWGLSKISLNVCIPQIYGIVSTILTPLGYRTFWFLNSGEEKCNFHEKIV